MGSIRRKWLMWKLSRKFAKLGKGCRFTGPGVVIDGHVELGDYCRIRDNAILRTTDNGKIIFGNRSGCSFYCVFEATELIQIGPRSAIAEFSVLRDSNHLVIGTDLHWRTTPLVAKPIVIGSDCLIGSHCYIMPGVTIGDGAVVQACSLVTKDIGSYEVWAGNPARRVCHRTEHVPEAIQRECDELIAKFGLKEDRYHYQDPKRIEREGRGE